MVENLLQKPRIMEKKDKNTSAKQKNNSHEKSGKVSAAATATAATVASQDVEESDFGGGYSDQSSGSYKGIIALDLPPGSRKNKKSHHGHLQQMKTSGAGDGEKMTHCQPQVWNVLYLWTIIVIWIGRNMKKLMLEEGKVVWIYALSPSLCSVIPEYIIHNQ